MTNRNITIKLHNASKTLNVGIGYFCGFLLFTLAFIKFIDIALRFILNKPIVGFTEITSLLLPWIVCLSFAYGLIRGYHTRMTIITSRLSTRFQKSIELIVNMLGFLITSGITYGLWFYFWASFSAREVIYAGPMTLPLWISKGIAFVGMLLFAIQFLIDFLKILFERRQIT
jgi:TRAP-type C4-dicarboxylate transport system permease small subunit